MPFLTPGSGLLYSPVTRRSLCLPCELWYLLDGAAQELARVESWELFGDTTPQDMAEYFTGILDKWEDCIMIGAVVPYASYKLPDGVLLCDGSMYSSEDYPELYSVMSPNLRLSIPGFPPAFFVPDLSENFILGAADHRMIGDTGGEDAHVLTLQEMPSHSHEYIPPVANIDLEAPGAPDILAAGVGLPVETGGSGGGDAHNNMPPYYKLVYGIIAR